MNATTDENWCGFAARTDEAPSGRFKYLALQPSTVCIRG
jgi:hypothetical protein